MKEMTRTMRRYRKAKHEAELAQNEVEKSYDDMISLIRRVNNENCSDENARRAKIWELRDIFNEFQLADQLSELPQYWTSDFEERMAEAKLILGKMTPPRNSKLVDSECRTKEEERLCVTLRQQWARILERANVPAIGHRRR